MFYIFLLGLATGWILCMASAAYERKYVQPEPPEPFDASVERALYIVKPDTDFANWEGEIAA